MFISQRIILFFTLSLIISTQCFSDTVFLKSGKEIKGIISKEDDSGVEIKIYDASGEMDVAYPSGLINSIKRNEEENEEILLKHKMELNRIKEAEELERLKKEQPVKAPVVKKEKVDLKFAWSFLNEEFPLSIALSLFLLFSLVPIILWSLRRVKKFSIIVWLFLGIAIIVFGLLVVREFNNFLQSKKLHESLFVQKITNQKKGTPKTSEEPAPIVDPKDVKSFTFNIDTEPPDHIFMLVCFRNNLRRTCKTYGILTIFRNRKTYGIDSKGNECLVRDKTDSISVNKFEPSVFSGSAHDPVFVVDLTGHTFSRGDVLIVEWDYHNMKRELYIDRDIPYEDRRIQERF